jgi:hypothetical protein
MKRFAALVLSVAAAFAPLPVDASTIGPVWFGRNVVVSHALASDTGVTQGEPRMIVTRDGRIFVSAHFQPFDCETGRHDPGVGRPCVWLSSDGGRSFRARGGEPMGQAGNDVDLAYTKRVILQSIMTNVGLGTGIFGSTVSRSTDGGRTWTSVLDATKQIINDRPYILAVDETNVIVTFTAPPGNIFLVRSTDQGATFGLPELVTPMPPNLVLSMNGPPIVDRKRGEIVVPYAAGEPICAEAESGCMRTISVARSRDGGATWTQEPVVDLGDGHGMTSILGLAADGRGREYVVYADTAGTSQEPPSGPMEVRMVRSDGPGKRWSKPFRIDLPKRTGMLPSVVAAGNGGVAVAWYASDHADAQTVPRRWFLRVAVSRDAGKTWTRTNASDHPVYGGAGAGHMPHVWDIIGLALGPDGRMHVVWTDLRGRAEGQAQIVYARQSSGAPLR